MQDASEELGNNPSSIPNAQDDRADGGEAAPVANASEAAGNTVAMPVAIPITDAQEAAGDTHATGDTLVEYELPEGWSESADLDDDDAVMDGHATVVEDEGPGPEPQDKPSPLAMASQVALDAHQSIREGITAFKDVRAASMRHADARSALEILQTQYDEHAAELEHRLDIEERYPQIIASQTTELADAQKLDEQARQHASELEGEKSALEAQLAAMKAENEERLKPYRSLAESTKGRADDAARTLAAAKRATKSAEAAYNEAVRTRDTRISAAHRSLDNAQERLRKVQGDLNGQQASGSETAPEVMERLQRELSAAETNLQAAQAEVPQVMEQTRVQVEGAQQRLFDLRQAQTEAEREADLTKREAQERRNDYDVLLRQAQEREKALSEQIKQRVAGLELAQRTREEAQARAVAAQESLDEAEAIHSTPQDTIALRNLVARELNDLEQQQDTVDELAADERDVRKGTFRLRLMLVLAAVGIACVIIAIVLLVVLHH